MVQDACILVYISLGMLIQFSMVWFNRFETPNFSWLPRADNPGSWYNMTKCSPGASDRRCRSFVRDAGQGDIDVATPQDVDDDDSLHVLGPLPENDKSLYSRHGWRFLGRFLLNRKFWNNKNSQISKIRSFENEKIP